MQKSGNLTTFQLPFSLHLLSFPTGALMSPFSQFSGVGDTIMGLNSGNRTRISWQKLMFLYINTQAYIHIYTCVYIHVETKRIGGTYSTRKKSSPGVPEDLFPPLHGLFLHLCSSIGYRRFSLSMLRTGGEKKNEGGAVKTEGRRVVNKWRRGRISCWDSSCGWKSKLQFLQEIPLPNWKQQPRFSNLLTEE